MSIPKVNLGIDFSLPSVTYWDFFDGKLAMGSKYVVRTNYELHLLATMGVYNLGLEPEILIDSRAIPWALKTDD